MVKEALRELIPPGIPPVARWRLMMFAAMVAVAVHITWACGLLPGLPGFAMAADVSQIGRDVTNLREQILTGQIFETRIRQCKAVFEGNSDAKHFWSEKLGELQLEYVRLTGQPYPIPQCSEL
jgi:hypothetical protein